MDVITDLGSGRVSTQGCAVTIGFYDGVHLGHQLVVGETRRLAAELGVASAVVTFDRHPAGVVRPASAPKLLTDLEQRLELLAVTGVDLAVVLTFDEASAVESAEHFVRRVLVDGLRAGAVVVGEDFHFGRDRRGDVALLSSLGAVHGFEVDGLTLSASATAGAQVVSSTAIRVALASGDLDGANRMLGRHHEVRGVVAEGDKRGGAELGYPTANVAVAAEILLPADGIYAGWYVRPDGVTHAAAVAVGRRPTFYEAAAESLLEAHLLDFSGDLYGEAARVRFVARLRSEERFDSVDALIAQMGLDCTAARTALLP